ncbi:MAG TPA: 6-phosphogluconolactonase [Actinomycetes bacterium]|nr:6-phosphogluconolactonase [Actinomycetes bacterium]
MPAGRTSGRADTRREGSAIGRVEVVQDAGALAEAAARAAIADIEAAVDAYGSCTWVLTGGTSPVAAYRRLAGHDLRAGVEWERVRVAMGDERCVPVDHPESNWGQASAALLDHVPVPERNLLRLRGELPAAQAAAEYEARLRALPPNPAGVPRLELVWLGVGPDGHCLSLFPGHAELEVVDRLVVAVHGAPKPPPDRVSLTLAALAGAERLLVLAAGQEKAAPVAQALTRLDSDLPIARAVATVEQAGGAVTWLLDRAAAG